MIIDGFQIFKYELELNKPLYVRGVEVHEREGFILKISANGLCGFGDVAPLSGLSIEGAGDALKQLQRLQSGLIDQPIPKGLEKLNGGFKKWLGTHNLSSSVQCGFELAVLNLLAQAKKIPLFNLISNSPYNEIQINGLLHGDKEEVKVQARQLTDEGYYSLKLKVGGDIEDAIDKVLALNPIIEGKAVLHIDANRSWSISQAVLFSHEVGLSTVDYIEEPFEDLKNISDFFMKTTIPIAIDETLQTKKIDEFKMINGLEILVIKPTVLGGFEACHQLIQQARSTGFSTVISSCFETGIGIFGLANLASISSRHQGAGLDTLKFFKEDVLKEPIMIKHGKMNIKDQSIKETNINYDILEEINI